MILMEKEVEIVTRPVRDADPVELGIDRRIPLERPAYPEHDRNAPMADSWDIMAATLMVVMMLGPLLAYALGFGA